MEKEPQNGTKRTTDGPVSSPQRKKEDRPEKDEVSNQFVRSLTLKIVSVLRKNDFADFT